MAKQEGWLWPSDGYYSATIDGKPFEAHFYAVGGFRFKHIPYVEFALLLMR
jgi:hypothetical protein